MRRLSTEVVATRAGENLLLRSGLAAAGLANLPRVPRTIVVGVRRGLGYRGVLVARDLAGGAAWEAVSLRITREKDDEAIIALVSGAALEIARREGHTLFLRQPEGSPHAGALRRAGLMCARLERLFAIPGARHHVATRFREARRPDRQGVFRLYCRLVPEHVRRMEAPTQQEWRAVLDSYDLEREYVIDAEKGLVAWAGAGEREVRLLVDPGIEGLVSASLDFAATLAPRNGVLVLAEDQVAVEREALARGYEPLGVRLFSARRLAALQSLKEVVAVPAESLAIPH
jgi:hypothetical protein